jgi:hypothetical protein
MDPDADREPPARPAWRAAARAGRAAACLLALGLTGPDRRSGEPPPVNIVFAPPRTIETVQGPPRPDPDCAPDRAGRYRTHGNRWGRYATLCIDRVAVDFEAYPDPSLDYSVRSERCPELGGFTRFRRREAVFELAVPEQIALLKRALADDLADFARRCGIRLDPEPFVDERFERFYAAYGDGWWFDRVGGEFRLTPTVREGGGEGEG